MSKMLSFQSSVKHNIEYNFIFADSKNDLRKKQYERDG